MLFVISFAARGQSKIQTRDSVDMKNQIEGFYSWYIDLIKSDRLNHDFNPAFVRQANGMTTLDFKKYKDGLKKYKFTEHFIQRKIDEYKDCLENLKKVPFEKFSQYTDLDEFEKIMCDFSNRYEWTGGQEPKDKAELKNLTPVDSKTILVQVNFTSYGNQDGTAKVTFKKMKKDWRVDNIELE